MLNFTTKQIFENGVLCNKYYINDVEVTEDVFYKLNVDEFGKLKNAKTNLKQNKNNKIKIIESDCDCDFNCDESCGCDCHYEDYGDEIDEGIEEFIKAIKKASISEAIEIMRITCEEIEEISYKYGYKDALKDLNKNFVSLIRELD